ncbi:MAG: phosphoribosyltransferase family protein, partial [Microbacteriaceae bacterium]|nr:phosphoribosyltransferase family protein [Microbacteriaceae bacterium]
MTTFWATIAKIWHIALAVLLPRCCVSCGRYDSTLCRACRRYIATQSKNLENDTEKLIFRTAQDEETSLQIVAVLPWEGAARRVMVAIKHGDKPALTTVLAPALHTALRAAAQLWGQRSPDTALTRDTQFYKADQQLSVSHTQAAKLSNNSLTPQNSLSSQQLTPFHTHSPGNLKNPQPNPQLKQQKSEDSQDATDSTGTETDIILVPMPSRKKKLRQRGYCHLSALLQQVGIGRAQYLRALHPTRTRRSQVGLGWRQRQANAQRLRVAPHLAKFIAGKKILLFDDTITTGATLLAAARALRAAGAVVCGGGGGGGGA